jgi:hypothetical protein
MPEFAGKFTQGGRLHPSRGDASRRVARRIYHPRRAASAFLDRPPRDHPGGAGKTFLHRALCQATGGFYFAAEEAADGESLHRIGALDGANARQLVAAGVGAAVEPAGAPAVKGAAGDRAAEPCLVLPALWVDAMAVARFSPRSLLKATAWT